MIEIGFPYLKEISEDKIALQANIKISQKNEILSFETLKEYKDYFVCDRNDAFVIILLSYAITHNLKIVSKAPISGELLEKINEVFIPTIRSSNHLGYNTEVIASPSHTKIKSLPNTVIGFSGGLDSMYALCELKKEKNLNYLIVVDAGVYEHKNHQDEFYEALNNTKTFAKKLNLSACGITCNINKIVKELYFSVFTFRIFSCVLALGKLFNTYYLSINKKEVHQYFTFDNANSFAFLSSYVFSNHYLKFHVFEKDKSREDMVVYFSKQDALIRDNIHVCLNDYVFPHQNCGYCIKCARIILYAEEHNCLDKFSKSFNLDEYNKDKIKFRIHHDEIEGNFYNIKIPKPDYFEKNVDKEEMKKIITQHDIVAKVVKRNLLNLKTKVNKNGNK